MVDLRRPVLTAWGERLDPDHPLPEHPRPQLVRPTWLNLNGRWQHAVTRREDEPTRYDGPIVVPFPLEAPLSGVRRVLQPDEVLHYRRTVTLPEGFAQPGGRVLLNLGAVDQRCRVIVDDVVVAEHDNGSLPITADVTDALRADGQEHVLRVVVRDPTDAGPGSRGKQRLAPGGIWYTPQSGIWQTVWLESVPDPYVDRLRVGADLATGTLTLTAQLAGPGAQRGAVPVEVVVRADGVEVGRASATSDAPLTVSLADPRPWSPEDPFLYDLEVAVGTDGFTSYTAFRSVQVAPDTAGVPRLFLNGRPYFHAGVLDQGWWPDGGYTAPSDDAMVHDIATMRRLGFTMLRKHVKVEPLRWYHHCDRLGMLVWQDFVNGGAPSPRYVDVTGFAGIRLRDDRETDRGRFGRADAAARRAWLAEAEATIEHLRDVPSIVMWVPFNEGWGQFDAAAVAARVRTLDPTRPVDHASGWHDQGAGDLTSRHVYWWPFRVPRRRRATAHRALALTEYGGYSLRVPGHGEHEREFGYRRYPDRARLTAAFRRLHEREIIPAIPKGLAASVYTQLSDVEEETNGLLTYDRRVLKVPEEVVRAVTARLRLPGQQRD